MFYADSITGIVIYCCQCAKFLVCTNVFTILHSLRQSCVRPRYANVYCSQRNYLQTLNVGRSQFCTMRKNVVLSFCNGVYFCQNNS